MADSWRDEPKVKRADSWRDEPRPQPMAKGKVLSDVLNQAGVGRALEAGGKLAEGVAKEATDPLFAARAFPPTAGAAELYTLATRPEEEAARVRSAASGVTLGGSAKLEGLNRKLLGDPQGMAHAEDATSKAVEKYPVENIAGNAVLPGGPEFEGLGFGKGAQQALQATGRAATQGAYGGLHAYFHGGDPAEGAAKGMLGAGAGELMSKAEGPLYNASGKSFVRAVGPRAGILDRMDREGVRVDNISELGHDFRRENLVPLLGSKTDAAKMSADRLKELGPQYKSLDERFNNAVRDSRPDVPEGGTVGARPGNASPGVTALMPGASTFNFRKASAAARPSGLDPEEAAQSGAASRFADRLSQGSGGLGEARSQMAHAAEGADFRFKPPLGARLHREALGRARGDMLDQVEEVLGPNERAALEELNRRYAVAKTANNLSTPAASREVLHQHASPLEMIEAAKLGGPKAALLEPLAAEALRRSNAVAGHGMYLGSLAAEAAPTVTPAVERAEEEESLRRYFGGR